MCAKRSQANGFGIFFHAAAASPHPFTILQTCPFPVNDTLSLFSGPRAQIIKFSPACLRFFFRPRALNYSNEREGIWRRGAKGLILTSIDKNAPSA
jgi:hypothetical protein